MYLLARTQLNPALAATSFAPALAHAQSHTSAEIMAEFGARVCYRSDVKFGDSDNFLWKRIEEGHLDVLEHAAAFVHFPRSEWHLQDDIYRLALANGYMDVYHGNDVSGPGVTIGANMRAWLDFWQHWETEEYEELHAALGVLLGNLAPRFFRPASPARASLPLPTEYLLPEQQTVPCVTNYGNVEQRVMLLGACCWQQRGYVTFLLENVSRALTHQLVRHRLGSFSQESQRYVDLEKGGWQALVPPALAADPVAAMIVRKAWYELEEAYRKLRDRNFRKEDARYLLPNAATSRIVVTMPYAGWRHFLDQRLDKAAQWEIRWVAEQILAMLTVVEPTIFGEELPF